MYKEDLALNNLEGLICYKTRPTQRKRHGDDIFTDRA